jgi:hypothetical protein
MRKSRTSLEQISTSEPFPRPQKAKTWDTYTLEPVITKLSTGDPLVLDPRDLQQTHVRGDLQDVELHQIPKKGEEEDLEKNKKKKSRRLLIWIVCCPILAGVGVGLGVGLGVYL